MLYMQFGADLENTILNLRDLEPREVNDLDFWLLAFIKVNKKHVFTFSPYKCLSGPIDLG